MVGSDSNPEPQMLDVVRGEEPSTPARCWISRRLSTWVRFVRTHSRILAMYLDMAEWKGCGEVEEEEADGGVSHSRFTMSPMSRRTPKMTWAPSSKEGNRAVTCGLAGEFFMFVCS